MSVKGAVSSEAGGHRRVRNPQGQGGRLRTELIAAADRLLARTGDIGGLSLRAVAREVGIATPSIYLHFPDKQALVRAVLDARFAELGAAVQAAVVAADGPAAKLRAGCLAYCRFAAEHPNAYRVLFGRLYGSPSTAASESALQQPPAPPATDGPVEQTGEPESSNRLPPEVTANPGAITFGFLVDGVEACMRAEVAPAGDPFRVATNVWTALHGIVTLRSITPGFPWPPLERQVDDVLSGMVGLRHNPPATEG
jgi:AcrR family transcriptional regulator